MAVDDLLHVAWHAQRDGRRPLREAMLTLAIGASDPGDVWAERCRARLLTERPGHFLGAQPTLGATLADPRVAGALNKLRGQYPPGRVSWLRFRAEIEAGAFTGESQPLARVVDALIGPPAEADVRRDAPELARGPLATARARVAVAAQSSFAWNVAGEGDAGEYWAEPPSEESCFDMADSKDNEAFAGFYMAVLLAIALLLATVERERDNNRRAA
jgi:hypothetical protein